MNDRPAYFESIREKAAERWDLLKRDPELAGPWHQLFRQVQSPRHILSELLQNADDAGATEASVYIEDQVFVFSHNGENFTEEHFASLCRFGYSNKRALHTVGFRGIGFKSTFSLGDRVELSTPTLSVAFDKKRFTEPIWVGGPSCRDGLTQVRIAIRDESLQKEAQKNLQEWLKSPISLLFCNHIRRVRINQQELLWCNSRPGPAHSTEWMALGMDSRQEYLVASSAAEAFPSEALNEIKQERLLDMPDTGAVFPPCKVEIVLGAGGQLYVVLPTGVQTEMPFACNAPFIQDPARLKIKDPTISPTNRWLLERIGVLASDVMLRWLNNTSLSLANRSGAYRLFPDAPRDDSSLEGLCAATIIKAFDEHLHDNDFVLTDAGELLPATKVVAIPEELYDVWPGEQTSVALDNASRRVLSRHVHKGDRRKLIKRAGVGNIVKEYVLTLLKTRHLPMPVQWEGLLRLWAYIAPEIVGFQFQTSKSQQVNIFPVQSEDQLYSAQEIVRLGEKRLLQSEADWDFLATQLLVLNQDWLQYLIEQKRHVDEQDSPHLGDDVTAAYAILRAVSLDTASDVSKVIEQVASHYFKVQQPPLSSSVRLAQIACKLGATVRDSFRFATASGAYSSSEEALYDQDGELEAFLPEKWCARHLLHPEYTKSFESCTAEEWRKWIDTGRAGLRTFIPFYERNLLFGSQQSIETELRRRGFTGTPEYPYKTRDFWLEDWDYSNEQWRFWESLAKEDRNIWGHLVEHIFAQTREYWSRVNSARAYQVATTHNKKPITSSLLLPAWIMKLRELPCLPDTRGFYHKPADLLRRTPETEPLLDVEPFVHSRFDTEANRPLLKLLGVRDIPSGPDRLLESLRALAKAAQPPLSEVEKWYRRLDQIVNTCSTGDFENIKKAFRDEALILSDSGHWVRANGVFISANDEVVPGANVLRRSVSDLTLWRKVGVAERPTADLVIQWLMELPSDKPLSSDEIRYVRAMLPRHAVRIWSECGRWLNLANEWVPTASLEYAYSARTHIPLNHLHPWVKQKTADTQGLFVEDLAAWPFSDLPSLESHIEERLQNTLFLAGRAVHKPWLHRFGEILGRIDLDDQAETSRVGQLADRLARTEWLTVPKLEIVPYVDGVPAGTPVSADVVWAGTVLYVSLLSNAKLARLVPDRLGQALALPDLTAALYYCYDRSPEEVLDYLEGNYRLRPMTITAPIGDPDSTDHLPAAGTEAKPLLSYNASLPTNERMSGAVDSPMPADDLFAAMPQTVVETAGTSRVITPHAKPDRPGIMERFALSRGYRKLDDDHFIHGDGSMIVKVNEAGFLWEKRSAAGVTLCHYCPKDHCLEREPLELQADAWGLIDKFPESHSLILVDLQEELVEIQGSRLREMRDGSELILYPATYRLVYNNDRK